MTEPDIIFAGARVLLAEDEAIVAMDLGFLLQGAGATVVGPLATLADTVASAQSADIDVALLDINLGGNDVFPAAEVLAERGVPFVFHTGHGDRGELWNRFPGRRVLLKPADPDEILRSLADAISDSRDRGNA